MTEPQQNMIVTLPVNKEQQVWANELDAKKHLLEIHENNIVLGPEFKKSRMGDKEKELILNMLPAAQLAIDICPNKEIGKEIALMDLHVVNALPIINFNSPHNHVLNRYTQWEAPPEEVPQDGNFLQRIVEKVKGDKHKTIHHGDEEI